MKPNWLYQVAKTVFAHADRELVRHWDDRGARVWTRQPNVGKARFTMHWLARPCGSIARLHPDVVTATGGRSRKNCGGAELRRR